MSKPEDNPTNGRSELKQKVYEVIFEADTKAGKAFDVALLVVIILSVVLICLESLVPTNGKVNMYGPVFSIFEWIITGLFTVEYILRIWCVRYPRKYIFSFYGIVDLLAILPTYIALFAGSGAFAVIRAIRLMRVFRILKLVWLLGEANEMYRAVWQSRGKIVVFLATVLIAVTIAGAAMYELEGPKGDDEGNVRSIPHGMYWAVVTMTTVGYGDVVPETPLGRALAIVLILLGYSLIIVPTAFVSAEFLNQKAKKLRVTTRHCDHCMTEGHDPDAVFCKYCGEKIEGEKE